LTIPYRLFKKLSLVLPPFLPTNLLPCPSFKSAFTSVGPSLARAIPSTAADTYLPPSPQICSIFITPTCSEEILKLINLLDDKKSTDHYDIPVRSAKLSKNIVCTYLADILNHFVENGVFPNILKLAKVISVFKSGAKDIASNYRPIQGVSQLLKQSDWAQIQNFK